MSQEATPTSLFSTNTKGELKGQQEHSHPNDYIYVKSVSFDWQPG